MRLFYCLFISFAAFIGGLIAFKQNTSFPFKEPTILYPATFEKPTKKEKPTPISNELSEGKVLFKSNCAQCHNKNMVDDLTGPALKGVTDRWINKEDLLYDWIRNSQAVISTGDEYANTLYKKWDKTMMNAFPNLSNEDIDAILAYVER